MAEEQDENTTILDDRINAVIRRIKKDRNRAGYQNIFTFLNRNEPKLDMQTLKARVNNMVERGVLLNKGKGDNESFLSVKQIWILLPRVKKMATMNF